MRKTAMAVLAVVLVGHCSAVLAGTPLPGYGCMMLNITEKQSMDTAFHVDVMDAPSPSAHVEGEEGAVVIVKKPTVTQNGYTQIIMTNGLVGWVKSSWLKPYHSLSNPSARCQAVTLPNGRIGFGPG